MIEINWAPVDNANGAHTHFNITHFEPELLFKYVASNRTNSEFLQCPAMSGYFKNTWVLRSPYDFTVQPDIKNNRIAVDGIPTNYVIVSYRDNDTDPMIVSFPPRYVFITNSKKPVTCTVLPYFFAPSQVGFVPGQMKINSWIRPQNYGVEIYSDEIISFKRGQPLYCVQFTTEDNDAVQLKRTVVTPELQQVMNACLQVKRDLPNQNLNTLYRLAQDYVDLMKRKIFRG
jgi:hypothetical protein